VNVWMREDGFIFDKLVLTANSVYMPTGTGPVESPQGGGATGGDTTSGGSTPVSVTNSSVFQQDSALDGVVSIEAEDYSRNVSQGGYAWTAVNPAGYSGSGALAVMPNNGTNIDINFVGNSPRLDYAVNFTQAGTYYVWVRGIGATDGDDSLHVGLDGAAVTTSEGVTGFQLSTAWSWANGTMAGAVATINVASAGVHTVNVWMREDGFIFDKLVLVANSVYMPTGTGPVESPQGGGATGGNTTSGGSTGGDTTVSGTSDPVQTGSITLQWTAPVARADGTPLSLADIDGYRIHYGESSGNYTHHFTLTDGTAQNVTLTGLPVGTCYLVMTTYDVDGRESVYSSEIRKTVQ